MVFKNKNERPMTPVLLTKRVSQAGSRFLLLTLFFGIYTRLIGFNGIHKLVIDMVLERVSFEEFDALEAALSDLFFFEKIVKIFGVGKVAVVYIAFDREAKLFTGVTFANNIALEYLPDCVWGDRFQAATRSVELGYKKEIINSKI